MDVIEGAAAVTTAKEGRWTAETLPTLLALSRVAALTGISRASAYRYAAAGELPTRRCCGRMCVVTSRLLAILDDSIEAGAD